MPETPEQFHERVRGSLRAVRSIGEIGNVHIGRYGDGSEHLHWWFFARPARFEQLRTSLIVLWDDVLPPIPEEIWQADVEALRAALRG